MINEILKVISEFKDLKLISGPKYRKGRDIFNEARQLVAMGNEFYDCHFEYKEKKFPLTFVPENDIRTDLMNKLKEMGFDM